MRLPAVEVRDLVRRAQISRIDRRERAVSAARAGMATPAGYKAMMDALRKERAQYEPPVPALQERATGALRDAIDETMRKARENVARLKAKRRRK